jgi:hypothetical protein
MLALKRSFAINGVVTEEEVGHDEPVQEKPQPKPEAPAPPSPFEEMINQFAELKARLGPEEPIYYEVLAQHGARHSNEFRDMGKARTAYRALLARVREVEAAQQSAEESAIIDGVIEEVMPEEEAIS